MSFISHYFHRPHPAQRISTQAEWEAATERGPCVLFIDGEWNGDVLAFRRPFAKFADWCWWNGVSAVTITIDPGNSTDVAATISNDLQQRYNLPRSALKNFRGAGRIVWLRDGALVDHENWCGNLMNWGDPDDIEALKARTEKRFAEWLVTRSDE